MVSSRSLKLWLWVVLVCILITGVAVFAISALMDPGRLYGPQETFVESKWHAFQFSSSKLDARQRMLRDLVTRVLPNKSSNEVSQILGRSPSYMEMRRRRPEDFLIRERDDSNGQWRPFPRTGDGHYFDELEWDFLYEIGREQIVFADHKGVIFSPDPEYLIVRFDTNGIFKSWYVYGSEVWPAVVGKGAASTFSPTRR